jgi:subtilisin family serine protease
MGIRDRRIREGIAVWEQGEDGFLYMPGQVLIDVPDEQLAVRVLDGAIERRRDLNDKLGVAHDDVRGDVPALVERLRKEGVRSGPKHVLAGEPRYKGGPGSDAIPGTAQDEPCGDAGNGVRIAVLDTGYTAGIHGWLDGSVDPDGVVFEQLDALAGDGQLDDEAGHGTFIAGIINRLAPAARITARQVLLSDGWGDEATISAAIADCTDADVINLSLGAYTQDNEAPIGLVNALKHVPRTSVVVAAAGNAKSDVPFWPAALKQVMAVAAVDDAGDKTDYTNFGDWVNCAAPGHEVMSTFPNWKPRNANGGDVFEGWACWSGTSFAAPYVAGLIAAEMTAGGGSAADAAHRVLANAKRTDPELGAVLA